MPPRGKSTRELEANDNQLQSQLQQQQQDLKNLTATVNNLTQATGGNHTLLEQIVNQLQGLQNQNQQRGGVAHNTPNVATNDDDEEEYDEADDEEDDYGERVVARDYSLANFLKNGAKSFLGSTEPKEAEAWTRSIAKSF